MISTTCLSDLFLCCDVEEELSTMEGFLGGKKNVAFKKLTFFKVNNATVYFWFNI